MADGIGRFAELVYTTSSSAERQNALNELAKFPINLNTSGYALLYFLGRLKAEIHSYDDPTRGQVYQALLNVLSTGRGDRLAQIEIYRIIGLLLKLNWDEMSSNLNGLISNSSSACLRELLKEMSLPTPLLNSKYVRVKNKFKEFVIQIFQQTNDLGLQADCLRFFKTDEDEDEVIQLPNSWKPVIENMKISADCELIKVLVLVRRSLISKPLMLKLIETVHDMIRTIDLHSAGRIIVGLKCNYLLSELLEYPRFSELMKIVFELTLQADDNALAEFVLFWSKCIKSLEFSRVESVEVERLVQQLSLKLLFRDVDLSSLIKVNHVNYENITKILLQTEINKCLPVANQLLESIGNSMELDELDFLLIQKIMKEIYSVQDTEAVVAFLINMKPLLINNGLLIRCLDVLKIEKQAFISFLLDIIMRLFETPYCERCIDLLADLTTHKTLLLNLAESPQLLELSTRDLKLVLKLSEVQWRIIFSMDDQMVHAWIQRKFQQLDVIDDYTALKLAGFLRSCNERTKFETFFLDLFVVKSRVMSKLQFNKYSLKFVCELAFNRNNRLSTDFNVLIAKQCFGFLEKLDPAFLKTYLRIVNHLLSNRNINFMCFLVYNDPEVHRTISKINALLLVTNIQEIKPYPKLVKLYYEYIDILFKFKYYVVSGNLLYLNLNVEQEFEYVQAYLQDLLVGLDMPEYFESILLPVCQALDAFACNMRQEHLKHFNLKPHLSKLFQLALTEETWSITRPLFPLTVAYRDYFIQLLQHLDSLNGTKFAEQLNDLDMDITETTRDRFASLFQAAKRQKTSLKFA